MEDTLNKWANSFSGCDGGEVDSDTWLCGIEWGYSGATEHEREIYYKDDLPKEIRQGEVQLNSDYNFFTDESMSYPFNRGFAKLYAAYRGHSVNKYNEISGKLLKLNLSPIGFWKDKEHLWGKYNLQHVTGYEHKIDFVKYLNSLNRYAELRKNNKPKLIVCVGVGRRNDFIKCFFGDYEVTLKSKKIIPQSENNKNTRNLYYARHDDTLLVVVPFFTSSNGLNSDYLLKTVGEEIASLVNY